MATVRKAKYIYKDGTYFEVGGDGVDQAARDAAATAQATADSKAAIDDTAPSATSVYSSDKVEQEITAAVADFVSFAEDQTSRTDVEKTRARANILAAPKWDLLWTNASPNSSFSPQTIWLDLSAYSFALIQTYDGNSSDCFTIPVGRFSHMSSISWKTDSDMFMTVRTATAAANGVIFEKGQFYYWKGSTSTNNGKKIPQKIWGIK